MTKLILHQQVIGNNELKILTENLTFLLHPCVNFTSHAEGNECSNEKLYF